MSATPFEAGATTAGDYPFGTPLQNERDGRCWYIDDLWTFVDEWWKERMRERSETTRELMHYVGEKCSLAWLDIREETRSG